MRMYIRTRLAITLLLFLTAVLILFSLAIYELTHASLLSQIDADVRSRARALVTAVQPQTGTTALRIPDLTPFAAPDVVVEILNPDGSIRAASGYLDRNAPDLNGSHLPTTGLTLRSGQPFDIYVEPVHSSGQMQGYVLVGRSVRTVTLALGQLEDWLIPGTVITLVFTGLLVWVLVRRALHPLEQLARSAQDVAAAADHRERLKSGVRSDEIQRLTDTINGMLDALDNAYQELGKAYHQVQEVNDRQRHFLTDVSHELRTPLTIMHSSLELMSRDGNTDPVFQAHTLTDMRLETERMAQMVSQLLMLARADEAETVAHQTVLLADVVGEACQQVNRAYDEPTLDCDDVETIEGAAVWGDPDHLKQLFLILLDNACKYTPNEGRVSVAAQLCESSVVVTVADTGIGIAVTDLPHIFERFYRAKNARARSGAGLGLAIAAHIAEQHGGAITVTSEWGKGSCFTVTLPLLTEAQFLSSI